MLPAGCSPRLACIGCSCSRHFRSRCASNLLSLRVIDWTQVKSDTGKQTLIIKLRYDDTVGDLRSFIDSHRYVLRRPHPVVSRPVWDGFLCFCFPACGSDADCCDPISLSLSIFPFVCMDSDAGLPVGTTTSARRSRTGRTQTTPKLSERKALSPTPR